MLPTSGCYSKMTEFIRVPMFRMPCLEGVPLCSKFLRVADAELEGILKPRPFMWPIVRRKRMREGGKCSVADGPAAGNGSDRGSLGGLDGALPQHHGSSACNGAADQSPSEVLNEDWSQHPNTNAVLLESDIRCRSAPEYSPRSNDSLLTLSSLNEDLEGIADIASDTPRHNEDFEHFPPKSSHQNPDETSSRSIDWRQFTARKITGPITCTASRKRVLKVCIIDLKAIMPDMTQRLLKEYYGLRVKEKVARLKRRSVSTDSGHATDEQNEKLNLPTTAHSILGKIPICRLQLPVQPSHNIHLEGISPQPSNSVYTSRQSSDSKAVCKELDDPLNDDSASPLKRFKKGSRLKNSGFLTTGFPGNCNKNAAMKISKQRAPLQGFLRNQRKIRSDKAGSLYLTKHQSEVTFSLKSLPTDILQTSELDVAALNIIHHSIIPRCQQESDLATILPYPVV